MTQELNTTQTFKDALAFTLQWEGGLSNHSSDKGGLTNYGITQRTYDNYRKVFSLDDFSVKDITMLEVQWIYYNNYWLASYCDRLPYPLNHVMFDSSVNHGSSKAIKILQRILGLKEDGVVGAKTLAAIDTIQFPIVVANEYINEREAFYHAIVENNKSQLVFIRGWINRLDSLRKHIK